MSACQTINCCNPRTNGYRIEQPAVSPEPAPCDLSAPVIDPADGTTTSSWPVSATITSADGADIYYTLDGSDPDSGDTLYAGPVDVGDGETLKAIAIDGDCESSITEATYVLDEGGSCDGDNLIPTMTSWTAPSGLAFANYESNPAWAAMDGDLWTDPWYGFAPGAPAVWIGYQFPEAQMAECYVLYAAINVPGATILAAPRTWLFQGSNDGVVWTTLDSQTDIAGWVAGVAKLFTIVVPASYDWYRLYVTANDPDSDGGLNYCGLGKFEIRG